jgi:putative SOS response-associated peptidase YedK
MRAPGYGDRPSQETLVPMRWGLVPSWWSKPLKFEAGDVQRAGRDCCRQAVLSRRVKCNRCLIPVSGYYEWQDTPSGEQPWYFSARDGAPALTIAGLWDEW